MQRQQIERCIFCLKQSSKNNSKNKTPAWRLFLFLGGYNMVTAYAIQRKKPQNYTKNRNFKNTQNLAKIDTSKILKCRHKNKKCRFLAKTGT